MEGITGMNPYLVVSKNPFSPRRDRVTTPLQKGLPLSECRQRAAEVMGIRKDSVALSLNGKYIPSENTNYLLMPGDSLYAYPEMGGFISVPMLLTGLLVGVVMTGVSMGLQFLLMEKPPLIPPPTPFNPMMDTDAKGLKGTLTYAYSGPMNGRQPGFPIPVQYGALRVGMEIINNYMETYGRNDVLYALGGLGEGPYESIAGGGMDEVWINNEQKLEEAGGTAEIRLGEASPTITASFPELHQIREINTRIRECTKLLITFENSPIDDESVYNHTVTVNGVSRTSSPHKTGAVCGAWTGAGDDLSIAENDAFALESDDFTIDFWIQPVAGSVGARAIINYCQSVSWTTGWRIRTTVTSSPNTMSFAFETTGNPLYSDIYIASGVKTVSWSTWYHVALTRQGSKWYWFIDGEDRTSVESSWNNPSAPIVTPTAAADLRIGELPGGGLSNWFGYLDEVHLYRGQPLYTKDFSDDLPDARDNNTGISVLTRGDVDKVSIHVQFPYGLYHVEDDGSLVSKDVWVDYDFREEGSTWFTFEGTPQLHTSGVRSPTKAQISLPFEVLPYSMVSGTFTVGDEVTGGTSGETAQIVADDTASDKLYIRDSSGEFTASETITDESGGTATVDAINYRQKSKYELRPSRVTDDDWDTKDQSVMVWGHLDEIYRQELLYPYVGLFSLYLPASDKVSGAVSSISVIADRGSISMPEWTANGGGTTSRDTSNPAWAALDMLTNTRYGAGVDIEDLDMTTWEAWATYCDGTISGSIKRAEFHGIFDAATTIGDAIQEILKIGRAMIARWGKNYHIIIDQPGSPVQLFSIGNIKPGSMTVRFSSKKNRPHAVQAEYLDQDEEFIRKTVTQRRDDYDYTTEPLRIEKEFLLGCTISDQAKRYAILRIQQANEINRSVQFEAGVDAVACEPGDIIQVQHDANALTFGGRVVSATSSTITLDRKITLAEATYDEVALLLVRLADDTLVEKEITGPWDTETDTFNISGTFSTVPEAKDVYAVGRSVLDVFEYRVTQMERTSEQHVKINGVEYVESVYYHDDYGSGTTII